MESAAEPELPDNRPVSPPVSPPESPKPPAWQRAVFVSGPRVVTAVLILIAIAINFANVVSRYLFDFALFWGEEIMIFIVLWCVFIGAVAVAFDGKHLKMDLLSARFPAPWSTIVNAVTAIALIGCCIFAAVQSWKAVTLFAGAGDVSVTASVPMIIPHSALFIGIVLMVLAVVFRLRAYIHNRFEG